MSEGVRDAVATMGNILPDDVGGRDAVHVAVISVVAGERLRPGEDVGFSEERADSGEYVAIATVDNLKMMGIVDPFLRERVKAGERFWLYIYPRMITGLKHQWSHPVIPAEDDMSAGRKHRSQEWLLDFAKERDLGSYHELLQRAEDAVMDGSEYITIYGSDAHGDIPDEFWDHVEVVTGKKMLEGSRPAYFSCSC